MDEKTDIPSSILNDDALLRASGAALVAGNHVGILRDGRENYPAWETAIRAAQKTIHLEMYIIHNDRTGRHFRDLLVGKAREGITVRVLYDWFGARSILGKRMWRPLIEAGGEVRVANPPRLSSLLGWVRRDHRKLLTVDGSVAFVSGLCIGDAWAGEDAWRDTGVKILGPAVIHAEDAFAEAWRISGGVIPHEEFPDPETVKNAGQVAVRVVATSPETAGLYRLDLIIAAAAQEYLWLTDAYFLGTSAYLQALRAAAQDGVDVRLLVPHGSDIQWIANFSRTSYRSLLEAGVRVFEWNGPMIHAKTAVCDGRWARVGSSNLNLSSWLGNWEMDVVVENEMVAERISEMFLEDLANATEVVIMDGDKIRPVRRSIRKTRLRTRVRSSGQSVLTRAISAGSALNAAMTGKRPLSKTESSSLLSIGLILCAIALTAVLAPIVIAHILAVVIGFIGIFLLAGAIRLRFGREKRDETDEAG